MTAPADPLFYQWQVLERDAKGREEFHDFPYSSGIWASVSFSSKSYDGDYQSQD